ncbi:MAG: PaaI family thioesterase [Aquificota bacterium]|nr:MAG: PaaI family thioesterase [Aquificota bacterium]
MNIKTHLKVNQKLCGEPISVEDDKFAAVLFHTDEDMVADEKGLIHGGFIFGAADYCAMLSVNHPNVVLGKAEVVFIKPVKIGDTLIFEGTVKEISGRKRVVEVIGKNQNEVIVFKGDFHCYVLDKHVLENY